MDGDLTGGASEAWARQPGCLGFCAGLDGL